MIEFIRRLKNKKEQKIHFGKDDIVIIGCRLSAVHIIPKNIKYGQEIDFYLYTDYDVYMLRLLNNDDNTITICPANNTFPLIYLVCRVSYNNDNIFLILESILKRLECLYKLKIKNIKKQQTIRL